VLNLYVPNGFGSGQRENTPYKLDWLSCFAALSRGPGRAGRGASAWWEISTSPWRTGTSTTLAVWAAGIMASDAERQALRGGIKRSAARCLPSLRAQRRAIGAGGTTAAAPGNRDRGWRIDHIYLTDDLIACATGLLPSTKWSAATPNPATMNPGGG